MAMKPDQAQSRVDFARRTMDAFATRTGLSGDRPATRYLWTDAFSVCNYLYLAHVTGCNEYRALARELIAQVHEVLGRHRADDSRSGWISGLSEEAGRAHPTAGGLRIGKPRPEREAGDPLDDRLEWERDGQYFHYLTKWAHALDVAGRSTGDRDYSRYGRELMQVACDRFIVTTPGEGLRMAWKMSIDLSRPLVSSMGHHDPLDGYVRCIQLRAGAVAGGEEEEAAPMDRCATRMARMIRRNALPTTDPLGLGGLLMDAAMVAQLVDGEHLPDDGLLGALLAAANLGLAHYRDEGELERSPMQRLAFRELGLCIGLGAPAVIAAEVGGRREVFRDAAGLKQKLDTLAEASTLGQQNQIFWLESAHRDTALWKAHENINEVMLATALLPDGILRLP